MRWGQWPRSEPKLQPLSRYPSSLCSSSRERGPRQPQAERQQPTGRRPRWSGCSQAWCLHPSGNRSCSSGHTGNPFLCTDRSAAGPPRFKKCLEGMSGRQASSAQRGRSSASPWFQSLSHKDTGFVSAKTSRHIGTYLKRRSHFHRKTWRNLSCCGWSAG